MPILVPAQGRFLLTPMILAVRQTKPLMDWTPAPRRCDAPPKIRLREAGQTISKERPYLTEPALRRKSEATAQSDGDPRLIAGRAIFQVLIVLMAVGIVAAACAAIRLG
ncbi:hypothetical protein [Bradyrhizobium sp. 27S5]|jgi:hypothetical protein|uniref:hypothetical protein n=1 Tax=Bradyrhizobium sp. 27S5 TaxID=3139728 RepID=UPI0030CC9D6E